MGVWESCNGGGEDGSGVGKVVLVFGKVVVGIKLWVESIVVGLEGM